MRRALGVGDADHRISSTARSSAALRFMARWISSTSPICSPTGITGLSDARGLLEDHRDAVAADLAQLRVRQREQVAAVEHDAARLHAAGPRDEPQDRQRRDALAAAGLADDAQDLAAVHVEVHARDRAHHARARRERGAQTA